MSRAEAIGRANQRRRTRKALLEAASRLMKQGPKPSLEEIAEEALVSRATAYRYFDGAESLLIEAALDLAVPSPEELFHGDGGDDPVARLERVEDMMHEMMRTNEAKLRMMIRHSLERGLADEPAESLPVRQNRRVPLIEAALAPARSQFEPATLELLIRALALVIGTESMLVFKDVLRLGDAEARAVKRWAIRALVAAARR